MSPSFLPNDPAIPGATTQSIILCSSIHASFDASHAGISGISGIVSYAFNAGYASHAAYVAAYAYVPALQVLY
jgi:hypothetical protein